MKVVDFIKETRGELRHVSWPTRRQALAFTFLVVGISIIVALILGFFDFIFISLMELIA